LKVFDPSGRNVAIFMTSFGTFLRINMRGLITNIRDRIYCRKTKASTSNSKSSPSQYNSPDCMQRFQRFFHFSMRVWYACLGMACNCRVVFSCISSTSWNRFPFRVLLAWGRRRSSRGPNLVSKAGGEPRGCCAWPKIPWYSGPRGMAHCRGAEARYRKTICEAVSDELHLEGVADSLIQGLALGRKLVMHRSSASKKSISIVLTFDRTCLAFIGRGHDGVFHCDSTLFLRMLVVAFRTFLWPS
jgi:hypothetical protein